MAINAVGEADREGKEILTGSGDFNASGELDITTPFATIDAVHATINKATAPTTLRITYAVDANVVTLHAWDNTGAEDGEETVSYMIVGRRWNN